MTYTKIKLQDKLKKFSEFVLKTLETCKDLTDKVPKKSDSIYEKVVKTAAMLNGAVTLYKNNSAQKNPYEYLKILNLYPLNTDIFQIMLFKMIKSENIDHEVIDFTDAFNNKFTIIISHVKNMKFALLQGSEEHHNTENPDQFYHHVFLEKHVDLADLFKNFWELFSNRLQLTYSHSNSGEDINLNSFPIINTPICMFNRETKILPLKFGNCCLIAGDPGVGKSSFINKYSEKNNKKLLKIDADILNRLRLSELKALLKGLSPDILLIDDFDRSFLARGNAKTLDIFERFHVEFSSILFILVSNYASNIEKALFRTGRIDYIIEFELPSKDERTELLNLYLSENTEEIAENSEGLSHSDVIGLAIKAKEIGVKEALGLMFNLKKYQGDAKKFDTSRGWDE